MSLYFWHSSGLKLFFKCHDLKASNSICSLLNSSSSLSFLSVTDLREWATSIWLPIRNPEVGLHCFPLLAYIYQTLNDGVCLLCVSPIWLQLPWRQGLCKLRGSTVPDAQQIFKEYMIYEYLSIPSPPLHFCHLDLSFGTHHSHTWTVAIASNLESQTLFMSHGTGLKCSLIVLYSWPCI